MPDFKAAAERLRNKAKQRRGEIQFFVGMEQSEKRIAAEADDYLLAAQALEALAWAENQKQPIECALGKWRILGRDQYGHLKYYYADTPLGALLAAMEGEKDDQI